MILKIFAKPVALLLLLSSSLNVLALETLCAKVKIEIEQELTLERQAFEATMKISNSLDSFALDNIAVDLIFKDENDAPVLISSNPDSSSAAFFVRLDDSRGMSGLTDLGLGRISQGRIEPGAVADLKWLIIPVPGAAKQSPSGKLYFIGAKLRFEYGGKTEQVVVADDTIIVKPLPKLTLDYFLTEHVFGDDAFTPTVEAVEPYTLGIRIANNGSGLARAVKLDTAQPKIVENELGLLIGFSITSSYVNDAAAEPSLLLNFGDIPSQGRTMGRWNMETTLSGKFTEFSATVSHAAEYGGELTSLIDAANTHFLLRDVKVDLPGRDQVSDFLAHNGNDQSLWVYESEFLNVNREQCSDCAPVIPLAAILEPAQPLPDSILHTLVPAENEFGFAYLKLKDPYDGRMSLDRVVRSDGRILSQSNAWLGRERNEDKITFDYFIYIFDHDVQGNYQLFLTDKTQTPQPPVVQYIPNKVTYEGGQVGFLLRASDPNGDMPDVSVELLPAGAEFSYDPTGPDFGKGVFSWFPQIGQKGSYPITFIANDGQFITKQSLVIKVNSADDIDGDGLLDEWEYEHFGDLSQGADGDLDNDGYSNLEEFQRGWNPLEAAKVPNVPLILSPSFDGETNQIEPVLSIQNSRHSDDISVTYTLEVFANSSLTERILLLEQVPEGSVNTDFTLTVLDDGQAFQDNHLYYWRVRGVSSEGSSEWAQSQFFMNTVNEAPDIAQLNSPQNAGIVSDTKPTLSVNNVQDVDRDALSYQFSLYGDDSLSDALFEISNLSAGDTGITQWQLPEDLIEDTQYFWQVVVTDEHGLSSVSQAFSFLFSSQNHLPTVPVIHLPADNQEVSTLSPVLRWLNGSDPEGGDLTYDVQWGLQADFADNTQVADIVSGEIASEIQLSELVDNSRYFWRVRANDGELTSDWVRAEFFANTLNDAPNSISVANPADNAVVEVLQPRLSVNPALDVDNDQLSYLFELYSDPAMTELVVSKNVMDVSWQVETVLLDNRPYYWHARAIDEHGAMSTWTAPTEFFVNNGGINDEPEFSFLLPTADVELIDGDVLIQWSDGDPDSNANISLWYEGDNGDIGTIVEGIAEDLDGAADQYLWHISELAVGTYSIKAIIEDEDNRIDITADATVTVIPAEGHALVSVIGDSQLDESGNNTAIVEIALDRAPLASTQVTMSLSISDVSEGRILSVTQSGEDKPFNYLHFNESNWNQPYRIEIEGFDDCIVDGDVAFDLVLAPFASADPGFNHQDPADITLLTQDNEDPEQTLFMCTHQLVSKTINGNQVEASYQANLMNTGRALIQVQAKLELNEKFVIKGSNALVFHSVSGSNITKSTDMITIRYDQGIEVSASDLTWKINVVQAKNNELPSGWHNENIGWLWTEGGVQVDGSKYRVTGSGSDIWALVDGFHYAYRSLTGDGEIVAQVNSLSNTHAWAKAGLMIRESNWTGGKHVSFLMTPSQGVDLQYRSTSSWVTHSRGVKALDMGSWIKLVRLGNKFSAYRSSNGLSWTLAETVDVSMDSSVSIGLAVTSHSWFKNATAEFEHVSVEQY
jgi:hypothetical protein